MNFLTFITTLLIILAFVCHTIQSDSIATSRLKISYSGYMRASRDSQNLFEANIYKKAREKPKTLVTRIEKFGENSGTKSKPKKPRKDQMAPGCIHLNLAALGNKNVHHDSVRYKLFAHMLRTFYGKSLFAKKPKNFEYQVADVILESIQLQTAQKEKNEHLHLAKLQLKDSAFQSIYYRMLKGTKDGKYPSLLDYIEFNPKSANQKICLSCATKELLQVLFNEELATELWKEKEHDLELLELNANKLEYLLQKHGYLSTYSTFIPLLKYHHGSSRSQKITFENEDESTGISIKRQVHYPAAQAKG